MQSTGRSAAAQRLVEACEMHDAGVAMVTARLRREHPDADSLQIRSMVQAWLDDRPYDSPGRVVAWPRR